MQRIYVALGSNVNREQNVALALTQLKQAFGELLLSPVYESEAVGSEGPSYYNLVVAFQSERPLPEIRACLRRIESNLQRDRRHRERVTMDLDLLLFGDTAGECDGLELPHPDLFRYRHVLQPFADIVGDCALPGSDQSAEALLGSPEFRGQSLRRVAGASGRTIASEADGED